MKYSRGRLAPPAGMHSIGLVSEKTGEEGKKSRMHFQKVQNSSGLVPRGRCADALRPGRAGRGSARACRGSPAVSVPGEAVKKTKTALGHTPPKKKNKARGGSVRRAGAEEFLAASANLNHRPCINGTANRLLQVNNIPSPLPQQSDFMKFLSKRRSRVCLPLTCCRVPIPSILSRD